MHVEIIHDDVEIAAALLADMVRVAHFIGDRYSTPDDDEVCITLTDDLHIQKLNRDFRKVDAPTDVLSFAYLDIDDAFILADDNLLGDIIISIERAAAQAKQYGHSFRRELLFLEIHGLLHLLGFDHILDDERIIMEREQQLILKELDIV